MLSLKWRQVMEPLYLVVMIFPSTSNYNIWQFLINNNTDCMNMYWRWQPGTSRGATVTSLSPDKKPLESQLANPATGPSAWKKGRGWGRKHRPNNQEPHRNLLYYTTHALISLARDEWLLFECIWKD